MVSFMLAGLSMLTAALLMIPPWILTSKKGLEKRQENDRILDDVKIQLDDTKCGDVKETLLHKDESLCIQKPSLTVKA